VLNLQAVRG